MSVIWKFPLPLRSGAQWEVEMPKGAKLLTVQMQGGCPTLWALVNADLQSEMRRIVMVGTGWERNATMLRYIATVQDGEFVWHFFENHSPNKATES